MYYYNLERITNLFLIIALLFIIYYFIPFQIINDVLIVLPSKNIH